ACENTPEGPRATRSSRARALLCATAAGALLASLASRPAGATPPVVGNPVVNPLTGLSETIVEVIDPTLVLTGDDNLILTVNQVGDTFSFPGSSAPYAYTVTGVTTNISTGLVDTIAVVNDASSPSVGSFGVVALGPGKIAAEETPPQGIPVMPYGDY